MIDIKINESKRASSSQTIFASQVSIKELGLAFKQASSSANELIEILTITERLIHNDKPGRKEVLTAYENPTKSKEIG